MNQQELFGQFCNGISKSVQKIYELSFSTIEKMVLKNSGTKEDAKDLFQEALLALLKYCEQGLTLTTALAGFIYSISKNLWLKKLKKKITFIDIEEYADIELPPPGKDQEDSEKLIIIFKCINKLPKTGQQIIKGFYIEGKSLDQIAEEMGYASKESLKVQKSKHLKTLRACVKSNNK